MICNKLRALIEEGFITDSSELLDLIDENLDEEDTRFGDYSVYSHDEYDDLWDDSVDRTVDFDRLNNLLLDNGFGHVFCHINQDGVRRDSESNCDILSEIETKLDANLKLENEEYYIFKHN